LIVDIDAPQLIVNLIETIGTPSKYFQSWAVPDRKVGSISWGKTFDSVLSTLIFLVYCAINVIVFGIRRILTLSGNPVMLTIPTAVS
jgi:predicted methyltransferase